MCAQGSIVFIIPNLSKAKIKWRHAVTFLSLFRTHTCSNNATEQKVFFLVSFSKVDEFCVYYRAWKFVLRKILVHLKRINILRYVYYKYSVTTLECTEHTSLSQGPHYVVQKHLSSRHENECVFMRTECVLRPLKQNFTLYPSIVIHTCIL